MSAWVLAWSWRQHGASEGALRLLNYLADQADDDGVVGLNRSLSRCDLAQMFRVSVDTIDRRLRELETDETDENENVVREALMDVERRKRPNSHGGVVSISSVYRLRSPAVPGREKMAPEVQGRNIAALVIARAADRPKPGPQIARNQGRNPAVTTQECGPGTVSGAAMVKPPEVVVDIKEKAKPSRAAPVAAYTEIPLPLPPSTFGSVRAMGDPAIPSRTFSKAADWLLFHVDDELLDETKSGALTSGAFEVNRWLAMAKAQGCVEQVFLEQVLLPLFKAEVQKRRSAGKGRINSWGLLTQDVRAMAAKFLAPIEPILPLETADGTRYEFDARDAYGGHAGGAQAARGGGDPFVDAAKRALARRAPASS